MKLSPIGIRLSTSRPFVLSFTTIVSALMLNPNQDDHVDRFLEVERSVVLPVSPYPRRYPDTRLKGDRRFITQSISFSFFSDIPWLPLKRTLRDELKGRLFSSKVAPEFVILLSAFDRKKNKNKKVEIFWRKKKKKAKGKAD